LGEWAKFGSDNLQVTLAPDGTATFKDVAGWDKVTTWSANWSLMTPSTAMIVLQKQLESHGNFEFGHYIGEAMTFTLRPDGRTATIRINDYETKLCRSLSDCGT
jgi:hypothetical protein